MRLTYWSRLARPISPSWRRNQNLWAVVLALVILVATNIAATRFHVFERSKIDANQIISPWDTSGAPPPFVAAGMVKIRDTRKVTQTAKNSSRRHDTDPRRRIALAE